MSANPIRLGPLVLTRPIGQGGMGTVWHARHPEGVDVAVKVLKQEYAAEKSLLDAFRFEVRSVASLDHPSIVRVFDYGAVPGPVAAASAGRLAPSSPWLSMEYAGAGTLGDKPWLETWPLLRDVLVQVLDALAHSHARDIVHRDLKPRNVLLHGDGRITLTDFGIAAALSRAAPTQAQAGTPGYMAPEQIRGEWRDLGPWSDLYSLGCLVWRLTTGNPPFLGRNKIEVLRAQLEGQPQPLTARFDLPPGFHPWAHRLIEREPVDRFACAADAAAALQDLDWAGAEGGPPPIPLDWRPRHPPTTVRPKGTGLALFILRPWPIVGREAAQDELWGTLRRVATAQRAEVVLIGGDAGVGKSRLARWLGERALETGAAWVLRARYDAEGKRDLRTAARAQLQLRDLDAGEAHERLAGWAAEHASPDADEEAAVFTRLLYPEPSDPLGAEEERVAWVRLFDRMAIDRPLLLTIDDLQWAADAPALLGRLQGSERRLLAVATLRTDGLASDRAAALDALAAHPGVREVPLAPLSPEAQRRLVEAGVGLTPRLAETLAERTAGNPLFAVRIVTDWARKGALVPTSTGFDLQKDAEDRLPQAIGQHFGARLDPFQQRHPGATLALEVLAALGGQRIREDEWATACDQGGLPLAPQTLALVAESGLATHEGDPPRWSFAHVLLKDALVQRAKDGGRMADHHRACARALTRQPRVSARERAVMHLVEAGDRETARHSFRTLVDAAWRAGQHDRLEKLLGYEAKLLEEEGLGAEHPARVLHAVDRAQLRIATEPTEAALKAARDALARAAPGADRVVTARAARVVLLAEEALGVLRASEPLFERAEQWHREADDRAGLVTVLRLRGHARRRVGDAAGAERDLRAAIDLAHGLHDPLESARVLQALAELYAGQGRVAEAEPMLDQARDVHRRAGDEAAAAAIEAVAAGMARGRGDLVHSLERARKALETLRRLGAPTGYAELQIGLIRLSRGELAQARREFADVLRTPDLPASIALVTRGAVLACAAATRSWAEWETSLAAWKALDAEWGAIDADAAWPLEWAARRAYDAGERDRAREAYGLAERRFKLLGDEESARRCAKRIKELETPRE